MPAWAVFGSQVVVGVLVAPLGSLLLIVAAALAYDLHAPESASGVLAAFWVSAFSFIAVGFMLAALLPTVRAAQGTGLMLFFAMLILSGADGPRELMPAFLKRIGDVLPMTHVVLALQDPWLGFGWNGRELLILLGLMVVAAALSIRLFRWA